MDARKHLLKSLAEEAGGDSTTQSDTDKDSLSAPTDRSAIAKRQKSYYLSAQADSSRGTPDADQVGRN